MLYSDVSRKVREAFASAHLPHGEPVAIETYDDEGASATFEGRRWQDIAVAELANVTACLHCLTPLAVRAYLPAFLVASLEEPYSGVADCTVSFIKPPKDNPLRQAYSAWWSLLLPTQRAAVISFLRVMPESMQGEHSGALKALEASANAR
jgi:hypothetical protein